MRVGILSDSHDNLQYLKKAVEVFREREVNLIIHAGDYVAPFSVGVLMRQEVPWIGVFGNNDGEILGLHQKSEGRIKGHYLEWEEGGYRIWVSHYYHVSLQAFLNGSFHLSIYGHTHEADIREEKGAFLVNPGETAGVLSGKSTIALVELDRKLAKLVEL